MRTLPRMEKWAGALVTGARGAYSHGEQVGTVGSPNCRLLVGQTGLAVAERTAVGPSRTVGCTEGS